MTSYVLGFDSRYWNGIFPEGYSHKFVYVKASEALGFVPENLERQVTGAENAGLEHGLYHFWRASADPTPQARHFYETARDYGVGNLPPVIDLEDKAAPKSLAMVNRIKDTCEAIEDLFQQRPMIYTASWWWDAYAAPYFPASNWNVSQYDLWVAHYNSAITTPYLPRYFDDWDVWQYVGDWGAPGFNAKIDVNRAKPEWFLKYIEPDEDDVVARLKDLAMQIYAIGGEIDDIADGL